MQILNCCCSAFSRNHDYDPVIVICIQIDLLYSVVQKPHKVINTIILQPYVMWFSAKCSAPKKILYVTNISI